MVKEVATTQNINFIKFSELYNWSAQSLLNEQFSYNKDFPLVPIGKFLKRNKTVVLIENDKTYKRVTIKIRNRGVVQRDTELGAKIGTKRQFYVSEGQFILSKIDARNGAMGIIPNELNGAIVTQDFLSYDIDVNKIHPQYLVLISTTDEFISFCQSCSNGTTNRQRIEEDQFLNVNIPLPPLNEEDAKKQGLSTEITQEKLVADYNQKIKSAEKAKQKAKVKKTEIESYLYKELGLQRAEKTDVKKGLHFVKFKDLKRWDPAYLLTILIELNSDFPLISYDDLFINLYNGIPARNYSNKGMRFLKVSDIKPNYISDKNVKYINSYKECDLISQNTLLITRKGTVGNSIFITEHQKYTASSEVFIIKINEEKVDGKYFSIVNNTEFVQNQYRENNTGTIMPSISQNKLKEIRIPIPASLKKQKDIVNQVSLMEKESNKYLLLSESLKTQATIDFENIIFKTVKK